LKRRFEPTGVCLHFKTKTKRANNVSYVCPYWSPVRRRRFWRLFLGHDSQVGRNPACKYWVITSQRLEWIRSHQSLALVVTEATNLLLRGMTDLAGVLFTLGGTAVNVGFVAGHLPSRDVRFLIPAKILRSA